MSTLVEVLDYEQTENMISPLVFGFDRVIYLYDRHHDFRRKRETLSFVLRKHGIRNIEFICVKDDSEAVFESILQKDPDAVFNCSNGSKTLLVQMSRFCERMKVNSYLLNFQRKYFKDLNGCSDMKRGFRIPHLSIEDLILLSGGHILSTSHALPEMSAEMEKDMMNIIEIMNSNSSSWTRLLSIFAQMLNQQDPLDSDLWLFPLKDKGQKRILQRLEKAGIIKLSERYNEICVHFKNRTLMHLFADSGAWLEYQAYLECVNSHLFDDVRISTVVDWNKESENRNDPTCEIDLIVINNCIPVFVSCKMNKCTALDLYEIKMLSLKLGGSLGKAAVISKAASLLPQTPLYLKAQELGIEIIGANDIEQGKIAERLSDFLKTCSSAHL